MNRTVHFINKLTSESSHYVILISSSPNQYIKNSVLTVIIFNLFFSNTSRQRLGLPPDAFIFFIRLTQTKSAGTCYTGACGRHRPSRETANPVNRVHRYTNYGNATYLHNNLRFRRYAISVSITGDVLHYYCTADRRRIRRVDFPFASLRVRTRTPYMCTLCELAVDVRHFARERRPRPEAADKAITLVFELSVASLKIWIIPSGNFRTFSTGIFERDRTDLPAERRDNSIYRKRRYLYVCRTRTTTTTTGHVNIRPAALNATTSWNYSVVEEKKP